MSVDVQVPVTADEPVSLSQVGQPCYVTAPYPKVGAVSEVEPNGTVVVVGQYGQMWRVDGSRVVVLPRPGECVAMPHARGVLRGYWVGLVPAVETGGLVTARVVVGPEVVEHLTEAAVVAASRVVVSGAAVDPAVSEVVSATARICALLDGERREHLTWKEQLNEAACERADDQGWCSDFDEFMADWGMAGRQRAYDVEVEVTGRVSVRVEASSATRAQDGVTREQVVEAVHEHLDGAAHLDFDVKDVEAV